MRRLVQVCVAVGLVCGSVGAAAAQMVVQDPSNLVQNTMSTVKEGKSLMKQIKELKKTIEILKQMKKDLEQLNPGNLKDLDRTFRELQNLYNQGKQLSMKWGRIGRQFNDMYEKYDASTEDKQSYREKRKKWEEQTDRAVRSAMKSHVVISQHSDRKEAIEDLVDASDGAEGTLAAIQAGNRICALLAKQLQELNELIVADSRARMSYIQERRMKQNAAQSDRKQNMLEGYGESESYEKPESEWPTIE